MINTDLTKMKTRVTCGFVKAHALRRDYGGWIVKQVEEVPSGSEVEQYYWYSYQWDRGEIMRDLKGTVTI